MNRDTKALDRIFVLAAAFLFSTGGAAIKASSLTSWQIAGGRAGIAAVALWIAMPGARRGWTWRTWMVGAAYAATVTLFVLANRLTTSADAIFLQSTAPLYMLLLGPVLLREKIRAADLAVIGAVAAGAALLLSGTETIAASAPDPHRGNAFAVASGLTWALTLTGLRWMGKQWMGKQWVGEQEHGETYDPAGATVIAGNVIAFAVCLPFGVPARYATAADVAVLLYLGLFQVGLAYLLLTRSLRGVRGLEAATLLLAEPVFNPLWTWVFQRERPSAPAIAGGVLIITAAFAGTWWQARFGTDRAHAGV